jgi:hypothetical protein
MIDYRSWLEHSEGGEMSEHLPSKPLEKNKLGGFDPETKEQVNIFKHVDLITLPKEVEGTNCSNCRFVRKQNNLGFCTHKEIQQWVTPRMCCAYWSHDDVKRLWENNSSK